MYPIICAERMLGHPSDRYMEMNGAWRIKVSSVLLISAGRTSGSRTKKSIWLRTWGAAANERGQFRHYFNSLGII